MKKIFLTRGMAALVDDADYDYLNRFKWFAGKSRRNFYALRQVPTGLDKPKQRPLRMHCEIMGVKGIDHRDGDGLNNQRKNLRVASRVENSANAQKRLDNSSGFKGVSFRKNRGHWVARVSFKNKRRYLGGFVTAEDAARAYDRVARELHGEFVRPNFPI